ncbi:MAG: SpvB/TcaC N-terminal domain-containing protein [Candidatus Omnitrophota bacterium]
MIGPFGGEVSSPGGRFKVIIPIGALSQDTPIMIRSAPDAALSPELEKTKRLLKANKYLPDGLIFNKPVTLICTLSQAQVPGTPIQLGIYKDSNNLEAIQNSEVETDSYTIQFKVIKFATYATFQDLTPATGAPIGGGVQIPLPDMFTGAFSSAVPIAVPPGRAGMQPNLALTYRSSNPNSWLGVGFNLSSGQITRSTRLGPPSYNDQEDTFYFISDNGTTELLHLIDNLYQARIESSFTKFFKQTDDSWKIIGKDGSTLFFGQTPDSKETSPKGTFSWYLNKAIDTNSNYIEYKYTKNQNKSYLSQINYTGSQTQGIQPTNTINFFLEDRTDLISSYISTNPITTAKRLKEIEINTNSQLVWRYKLEYDYSQDTNRSLLKRIRQLAADNKELPVQEFDYQRAEGEF